MRDHKALRIIICVIAIVFVGHQIYSSAYKPITTVSAEYYTAVDGFTINTTIVREEKIISSNASGTLHFSLADGERVAKNGIIANIYSDAQASVAVNRIEQLKSRISDIEEIQGYNDVAAADITLANNKVNNSLNKMIREIATGDFSTVENNSTELLTNISRRQMITGEQTDFSAHLSELKSELDALNKSLPQPVGSIKTDTSGYFVSGVDGYETMLSCSNIDQITPEYLNNLKPDTVSENAIGKRISRRFFGGSRLFVCFCNINNVVFHFAYDNDRTEKGSQSDEKQCDGIVTCFGRKLGKLDTHACFCVNSAFSH